MGDRSSRRTGSPVDPRVVRTQKHVLDHARQLLIEQGPAGMTFSALAARAEVARQTLYRYWDGPEALVGDLVRRRDLTLTETPREAREALRSYLVDLRETLADPAIAPAIGMLMAGAEHNGAAARALQDVVAVRLAWLNDQLSGLRPPLDEDEFATLTGPLVYARLCARRDISDHLIDGAVDAICRSAVRGVVENGDPAPHAADAGEH
jgi:AcrR family transcriptional regulator